MAHDDQRSPESDADTGTEAGAPLQPHGDPLLAAAQGRGDGDDATRHGWGATAQSAPEAEGEEAEAEGEEPGAPNDSNA